MPALAIESLGNRPVTSGQEFLCAEPFPHAVYENVLNLDAAESLLSSFPTDDWQGWKRYGDAYQPGKLICSSIDDMPMACASLLSELNGPRVLRWLEALTEVSSLIPDPYLEGGGLHCTMPGGVLTPHTDFHVYSRLDLYRRLNVIIYLNPCWEPGDGGELELYEVGADEPAVSIEPVFGRMVVFQTDDRSVHGFTNPVREGTLRRSVAAYYYTAAEAEEFSGDTNTYWRSHDAGGTMHGVRMAAYRGLLFASRGLSWLAHRTNPNLGRNVKAR